MIAAAISLVLGIKTEVSLKLSLSNHFICSGISVVYSDIAFPTTVCIFAQLIYVTFTCFLSFFRNV